MSKEQGKLNPLFIIVVAVIILTLFVRYSFEDSTLLSAGSLSYPTVKTYMGIFFIVFSLLKLCDLDKFAEMFRSYDFIAKKFYPYAWLYPFAELGFGISYLFNYEVTSVNFLVVVLLSVETIGVLQHMEEKKPEKIRCACLGPHFELYLSTATIVENTSMVLLAALMML